MSRRRRSRCVRPTFCRQSGSVRTAGPLSRYDRSTFYGSDGRGHIDDPRYAKTSLSELQFLTGAVACPETGASHRG
jgi:hypothetical protein